MKRTYQPKNRQEKIDSINEELANLELSSETSGVYKKLENDIQNKKDEIAKYEKNGWDETRSKKYDKLLAELDNLNDLQAELDAYATTNNISNYKKVYTKFQQLENKIDSGKDLKPSEQKKYDSYLKQLEEMRDETSNTIDSLNAELGLWKGTIVPESEADLKAGKISCNTPIAKGLLGKSVGEVAEITIPSGKIGFEILEITI